MTFSEGAWFGSATFSGDAGFDKATFSRGAGFDGATFSKSVTFSEATFSGFARFTEATFSGGARFDRATFSGGAWFTEATFSGGVVGFTGARFNEPPLMEAATISGLLVRTDGTEDPSGELRPSRPYVAPATVADPDGAGVAEPSDDAGGPDQTRR